MFDIADGDNQSKNIYELMESLDDAESQNYKYVRIHKEIVTTIFGSHEVLQIIDVSEKVQCEKAEGEKKLKSLINATVSHEMRNPVNSI